MPSFQRSTPLTRDFPVILVLGPCFKISTSCMTCVNCGRIIKIPRFGYTFRLAKIKETRSDQEVERNLVISLFTIEFMVGTVSGIDLQE